MVFGPHHGVHGEDGVGVVGEQDVVEVVARDDDLYSGSRDCPRAGAGAAPRGRTFGAAPAIGFSPGINLSRFGTGKGDHTITSGIEGAWTPNPTKWDNGYFDMLFGYEWELTKSPAGAHQWRPKDGAGAGTVADAHDPSRSHAPMMTTADLSLRFADSLIRNKGGMLNVASIASFLPGPRMAVYYATKAYVISLSEALHQELKTHGVVVSVLCPGTTATQDGPPPGELGSP